MNFLKSNVVKLALKLTISVVLIYFVFRFIGINKIYKELVNANVYYIAISLFFTVFLIIFKAIRWKNIIGMFNIGLNLGSSVKYTLISIAFSLITPSKLGEFIKVKYLTDKTGVRYLKSFITVVIDKGFDIVAMTFLAFLGLMSLQEFSNWSNVFRSLFFIYSILLILVFVLFDQVLKLVYRIVPKKYKESFKRMKFSRMLYLKSIVLSLIIWVILSTQASFILKSLGMSSSLLLAISIVPLMALANFVPISLGGIGIREVIAISFFIVIGISAEKSIVFSLMYTFITAGVPALIGSFLNLLPRIKNKK